MLELEEEYEYRIYNFILIETAGMAESADARDLTSRRASSVRMLVNPEGFAREGSNPSSRTSPLLMFGTCKGFNY